jgi:CheY-like chemotaxis protein
MYKLGILVIDDDPSWLRMIKTKVLDDSKYQIVAAASCAEGLKLAASLQPDCILLDYHALAYCDKTRIACYTISG